MQEYLIKIIEDLLFNFLQIEQNSFYESLAKTTGNFIFITTELFILFILITAIIEFIMMHINHDKLQKLLKGKGIIGNFAGAAFGAITPFCACSTIPMTVGFLNAGLPFGAIMSFLISSPILNPIIIAMLIATIGSFNALIYFCIAFALSVIFGYLLEKLNFNQYVKQVRISAGASNNRNEYAIMRKLPLSSKIALSLRAGWNSLRPILPYLFIGVSIGAAIYGYLPEGETIAKYAGESNVFAVPIASIIGIPLYIRAETAIPIAMSLITKGVGMGTAIALIIGGAGMAIPEMTMMAKIFKTKLLISFIVVIFLVAVTSGYIFNLI